MPIFGEICFLPNGFIYEKLVENFCQMVQEKVWDFRDKYSNIPPNKKIEVDDYTYRLIEFMAPPGGGHPYRTESSPICKIFKPAYGIYVGITFYRFEKAKFNPSNDNSLRFRLRSDWIQKYFKDEPLEYSYELKLLDHEFKLLDQFCDKKEL